MRHTHVKSRPLCAKAGSDVDVVFEKSKGLLRVVVLLLFAAVCYHLGYNTGYTSGECDTTRVLRRYEDVVAEAETIAMDRLREASMLNERLAMASTPAN